MLLSRSAAFPEAGIISFTFLGACNPKMALEALSIEDKVGTMLPCS